MEASEVEAALSEGPGPRRHRLRRLPRGRSSTTPGSWTTARALLDVLDGGRPAAEFAWAARRAVATLDEDERRVLGAASRCEGRGRGVRVRGAGRSAAVAERRRAAARGRSLACCAAAP